MNIGTTKFYACAALLLATMVYSLSVVRADENPIEKQRDALNRAQQILEQNRSSLDRKKFGSPIRARTTPAAAIRSAAEAVRDAKGDEAKSEAQKNLTDILSKCYDDDMTAREDELKQIADRLTKLRELLERRRAKKQDIIDLQTKVALNEADGLGFYDSERQSKSSSTSSLVVPIQIDGLPVKIDGAFGSGSPYAQPAPQPVAVPKVESSNPR